MEDKKLDYNKKVKQSKNLARFRYRLSLNEQKLLLCFFSRLKQTDTEFIKDEISVMEAAKFCGFNNSNPYRLIKYIADSLTNRKLSYYNGKDFTFIPWFAIIKCSNGKIIYKLNDELKNELLQLDGKDKLYISIHPLLIPLFQSNDFGIRLYLILKGDIISHRYEVLYSLEEIHSMLILSSAYNPKEKTTAAGNQRMKVIDPAVKEINAMPECDFSVTYEPVKDGRKITGWRFFLKEKLTLSNTTIPQISTVIQAESAPSSQVPQSQNEWENDDRVKSELNRLLSIGVDALELNQILKLFTNAEQFLQATAYADKIYEKSLKNPAGVGNPGGLYASTLKKYAANPDTISLFEDVQNEQTTQNEFKATAIKLAMDNAATWEEIVDIAMQQSSISEATKVLHEAESKRPELLARYQKAYELKYNDRYDLMLEIARMNIPNERGESAGVSALKPPKVDYSLI